MVPRNRAEGEYGEIGKEQSGRAAPLRPGRDETAMGVGFRPLHCHQSRTAPLAPDADTLNKSDGDQDDRTPNTDRVVARDKTDGKSRETRQQQRRDQRCLTPDAVPVMAE